MSLSENLLTTLKRPALPQAVVGAIQTPVGLPPLAGELKSAAFAGLEIAPTNLRCAEKGCVFPAAPGAAGKCLQHHRQDREPVLFASHQPTRAVVEHGRFGIPDTEVDTSRNRDRRRLAAIREAFLED